MNREGIARSKAALRSANDARTAAASERNWSLAREALDRAERLPKPVPGSWLKTARTVSLRPGASWEEIADLLGVTKSTAWSRWRRLLVKTGLRRQYTLTKYMPDPEADQGYCGGVFNQGEDT